MKAIWKFPVQVLPSQVIEIPGRGGEVIDWLDVQIQPGVGPVIWALVNTDLPKIKRRIHMAGTGHELPDGPWFCRSTHIGTMIVHPFVWHVFDGGSAE